MRNILKGEQQRNKRNGCLYKIATITYSTNCSLCIDDGNIDHCSWILWPLCVGVNLAWCSADIVRVFRSLKWSRHLKEQQIFFWHIVGSSQSQSKFTYKTKTSWYIEDFLFYNITATCKCYVNPKIHPHHLCQGCC